MFTLKSSALALACAMLPPVFAQSTFKITDLGVLPGTSSSWAAAINELGEVAGFSGDGPDAFCALGCLGSGWRLIGRNSKD